MAHRAAPRSAGRVRSRRLPGGTVTFLFTDVEGSTRLWEDHPDVMHDVVARHDAIVRGAIESHGGQVVKTTGDGFHAAFGTARDALEAALAAQQALAAEPPVQGVVVKVRMGVHTGEARVRDGDYYGSELNRAARLMAAGHGGQVLVSDVTHRRKRTSSCEPPARRWGSLTTSKDAASSLTTGMSSLTRPCSSRKRCSCSRASTISDAALTRWRLLPPSSAATVAPRSQPSSSARRTSSVAATARATSHGRSAHDTATSRTVLRPSLPPRRGGAERGKEPHPPVRGPRRARRTLDRGPGVMCASARRLWGSRSSR